MGGKGRKGKGSHADALRNAVVKIVKGRPEGDLLDGEIIYSSFDVVGGKQAQVIVTCLPSEAMSDVAFNGHLSPTEMEAKESCAQVALEAILADPQCKKLHDREGPGNKRSFMGDGQSMAKRQNTNFNPNGPRAILQNQLEMLLGRPLMNRELRYNTRPVGPGMLQCQLLVTCLPGPMANVPFAGEICPSAAKAEDTAAFMVLTALQNDPQMMMLTQMAKGKGKGMGKGKEKGSRKGKEKEKPRGPKGVGGEIKALLNATVLKITSIAQPSKDFIQYTTNPLADGTFQSQVVLPYLPKTSTEDYSSVAFVGEPCTDPSAAEGNAANQALQKIMADPELVELHDKVNPNKKERIKKPPGETSATENEGADSAASEVPAAIDPESTMFPQESFKGGGKGKGKKERVKIDRGPGGEIKALLNSAVLKITSIAQPTKDLIKYTTTDLGEGMMQSQVVISALPNELADVAFVGEVCTSETAAVDSAASQALQTIMADETLRQLHDRERPKKLLKSDQPCRMFIEGRCRRGDKCRHAHVMPGMEGTPDGTAPGNYGGLEQS
eukprot:gnl/MRDRNA2_/MRDRNA2_65032_c0_seq1.p1 gnl/MRDRNA2_/MRDRNA2_65032_c0~~gnl/MRDRNA2_/MRDRNA2_65032_c0_seq1.p1  ORF type:complete len:555 (+),score=130.75 gnl/MRDRNA2_/MRDRNA2_65032_c0_seq1:181-1845(+)